MTDRIPESAGSSDAELVARVRAGDSEAFADLYDRHQQAAHRLARQLTRGGDTDDLVSEAFTRVLVLLQDGAGPDVAFRAYLLTAVRRLYVDRVRGQQRVHTTDDVAEFDPGVPFQDTAVDQFERRTTARAFASLPERWQMVLWHLDVERQKPAEVAPLLGMSANGVSALAYRAREGLRQAYLQMHLAGAEDTLCRWTTERLGAYVRDGLGRRESRQVRQHLDECPRCTAVYLELVEVNSNLRGVLAPLLLGAAGTGYLTSTPGAATGAWSLVSRAAEAVKAASPGTVGAGAAGTAAAAAVTLALVIGPGGAPAPEPGAVSAEHSLGTPAAGEPDERGDLRRPAGEEPAQLLRRPSALGPAAAGGDPGAAGTASARRSGGASPGAEDAPRQRPGADDQKAPPAAGPENDTTGAETGPPASGPGAPGPAGSDEADSRGDGTRGGEGPRDEGPRDEGRPPGPGNDSPGPGGDGSPPGDADPGPGPSTDPKPPPAGQDPPGGPGGGGSGSDDDSDNSGPGGGGSGSDDDSDNSGPGGGSGDDDNSGSDDDRGSGDDCDQPGRGDDKGKGNGLEDGHGRGNDCHRG